MAERWVAEKWGLQERTELWQKDDWQKMDDRRSRRNEVGRIFPDTNYTDFHEWDFETGGNRENAVMAESWVAEKCGYRRERSFGKKMIGKKWVTEGAEGTKERRNGNFVLPTIFTSVQILQHGADSKKLHGPRRLPAAVRLSYFPQAVSSAISASAGR